MRNPRFSSTISQRISGARTEIGPAKAGHYAVITAIVVCALTLTGGLLLAQELIDRVLAVVTGQIITLSDVIAARELGLHAAGADVGGISGGGYSSGLAAALVFGRIAAEEALS